MKEFQHPFLFTFFIFFKQKTKNLPHLPEKVPKMVGIWCPDGSARSDGICDKTKYEILVGEHF